MTCGILPAQCKVTIMVTEHRLSPGEPPSRLARGMYIEIPGWTDLLAACEGLRAALLAVTSASQDLPPAGVRPGIHKVTALLGLPSWPEVVKWSATLGADLRDLTPKELAYLEQINEATLAKWRSRGGIGPPYRNEGRILYPVEGVYKWRQGGRQENVSQRPSRSPRESSLVAV